MAILMQVVLLFLPDWLLGWNNQARADKMAPCMVLWCLFSQFVIFRFATETCYVYQGVLGFSNQISPDTCSYTCSATALTLSTETSSIVCVASLHRVILGAVRTSAI